MKIKEEIERKIKSRLSFFNGGQMGEGSLTMVYFEYLPSFNPFSILKQKQSH
jgi:hypothetical protein